MNITREASDIIVKAETYRLIFRGDRPFVTVENAMGETLADLFPFTSVNTTTGQDETYQRDEWVVIEAAESIDVSIAVESTAWSAKTIRFHCTPQRFSYHVEVEGTGRISDVQYLGGYYSASLRWGSGFFWSGQQFEKVFNPEPNSPEVFHHAGNGTSKIDLTGVPLPNRADWFFTPPPFCFAAQVGDQWLAMGVEARAGTNTYTEFAYHGSLEAFYLTLAYEGHTRVDGHYELPAIGFDFAADEYAALRVHSDALRAAGHVPALTGKTTPSWWRSPIFCGWGSQCYVASLENGHAPNYARQDLYEGFMSQLAANQLNPGIVVLDDKWQATYGENRVDEAKWPDVRGFIKRQHEEGRRVLLWLKAWDPEGLPIEECVVNRGGMAVAADPTNPLYEARLRASVRNMLSAEGYDADGFKIDFTARISSGPGLNAHDDSVWGIEMMRRYLWIVYSEAKLVKPDALVMSHTPHPYLADVTDMIRLNDINKDKDVIHTMTHRAKVAAAACPEAIIDTDNWPITNKSDWRAYVQLQPKLGVPSLYYVSHIDATREPLTADDFALLRAAWAQVAQGQNALIDKTTQ